MHISYLNELLSSNTFRWQRRTCCCLAGSWWCVLATIKHCFLSQLIHPLQGWSVEGRVWGGWLEIHLSFKEILVLQIEMAVMQLDWPRDGELRLGDTVRVHKHYSMCHRKPRLLLQLSPNSSPRLRSLHFSALSTWLTRLWASPSPSSKLTLRSIPIHSMLSPIIHPNELLTMTQPVCFCPCPCMIMHVFTFLLLCLYCPICLTFPSSCPSPISLPTSNSYIFVETGTNL